MGYQKKYTAAESDSDSEDMGPSDHRMSLEETQAERDQKEIMRQDLGPDVRNWITSVEKGRRTRTNVNHLLAGRECNQKGTEAATFAATHKSQIIEWHNYKNTTDAKEADFERLEDIAGGQSHRQITQARLEELKLARGGALTLDNLDYGGRQPYGRPPGRGTTTGGRGGGNAGRGAGRSTPSAPRDRPLGPAVDPSRPYGYAGKGSNRGGYQGTSTQSHVSKPATSTSTAPTGPKKAQAPKRGSYSTARQVRPWPPMALMENPVAPSTSSRAINAGTTVEKTTSPSASSMMSPSPTLASTLAPQRYATQGQRSIETRSRTYGQQNAGLAGTLDDVQAFMAAARKNFQVDDGAPVTEPKAIVGFGKKQGTLPIPNSQSASGITSEKLALLDRAGLRPTRQSPGKFTDGIPSNTDRSGVSPTAATEADLIGLGISGVDAMGVGKSDTRSEVDNGASPTEDLMDMSVPEVVRDALVPKVASEEEMVSIPKSEAEMWKSISGFLKKNDGAGMQRYLLQIVPQLHTVKETTQPTSHAAEVKANVVEQLEDLIGDRNLPIRSTASQTTPSLELGKSKWAAPTLKLDLAFGKVSNWASKAKVRDRATGDQLTDAPIADVIATKPMLPLVNPFSSTTVDSDKPDSKPLAATTNIIPAVEAPKAKLQTQDQLLVGLMYSSARPAPARPVVATSDRANKDVDMSDVNMKEIDNPFAAPFKPANTLGASSTRSSATSKSGLGGSKFADPAYKPPVNVSSALRPKPSNQSRPKKPAASAMSPKPNDSIFGDARNISRHPDAVKKASFAMRTYPAVLEKSTAIKRTNAGAGFAQMMKDHEAALARNIASNNGRG